MAASLRSFSVMLSVYLSIALSMTGTTLTQPMYHYPGTVQLATPTAPLHSPFTHNQKPLYFDAMMAMQQCTALKLLDVHELCCCITQSLHAHGHKATLLAAPSHHTAAAVTHRPAKQPPPPQQQPAVPHAFTRLHASVLDGLGNAQPLDTARTSPPQVPGHTCFAPASQLTQGRALHSAA